MEEWIIVKQGEFKIFLTILVLPVVDFILCFKKKDLNGRESIFKQIYELSDVSMSLLNLYLYFVLIHQLGSRINPYLKMNLVFSKFSLFWWIFATFSLKFCVCFKNSVFFDFFREILHFSRNFCIIFSLNFRIIWE